MNCPTCGHAVEADARLCNACGGALDERLQDGALEESRNPFSDQTVYEAYAVPSYSQSLEDNPALRMVIPVGQSPLALISGYLGLISLFFCFLGPIAILLGAMGIRQIRNNPRMHGTYRAVIGIVLGAISTLALIAVIVIALSAR